jgi:hypothetical protein
LTPTIKVWSAYALQHLLKYPDRYILNTTQIQNATKNNHDNAVRSGEVRLVIIPSIAFSPAGHSWAPTVIDDKRRPRHSEFLRTPYKHKQGTQRERQRLRGKIDRPKHICRMLHISNDALGWCHCGLRHCTGSLIRVGASSMLLNGRKLRGLGGADIMCLVDRSEIQNRRRRFTDNSLIRVNLA